MSDSLRATDALYPWPREMERRRQNAGCGGAGQGTEMGDGLLAHGQKVIYKTWYETTVITGYTCEADRDMTNSFCSKLRARVIY